MKNLIKILFFGIIMSLMFGLSSCMGGGAGSMGSGNQSLKASLLKFFSRATAPELQVNSSLFGSNVTLFTKESSVYQVQLVNNTTGTGFLDISVIESSLTPINESYANYTVDTNGVVNPCNIQDGLIVLQNTGDSCNYNLHVIAKSPTFESQLENMAIQYKYLPHDGRAPVMGPPVNVGFSLKIISNFHLVQTQPLNDLNTVEYISNGDFIFGAGDSSNNNKSWVWYSNQDPNDVCVTNPSRSCNYSSNVVIPNGIDGITVLYPKTIAAHFINNSKDGFAYSPDGGTTWIGPYYDNNGFAYNGPTVGKVKAFGDSCNYFIVMSGGQSQYFYNTTGAEDNMHAFSLSALSNKYSYMITSIAMTKCNNSNNPYSICGSDTAATQDGYATKIVAYTPPIYDSSYYLSMLPKGVNSIACVSESPALCVASIGANSNVLVNMSGYTDQVATHYSFVGSYAWSGWKLYKNVIAGTNNVITINKVKSMAYLSDNKFGLGFDNNGHVYVQSGISSANATVNWTDISPSGNTIPIVDAAANNDGMYLIGNNIGYFYPKNGGLLSKNAIKLLNDSGTLYNLDKIACNNDYTGNGSGRCIAIGKNESGNSIIVSTVPH